MFKTPFLYRKSFSFLKLRWIHQDLRIPQNKTLTQVLLDRCHQFGNDPAVICGITGKQICYESFGNKIKKVASSLNERGVTKGTVVMTNSINCLEYPILFHALSLLGAILSPASPQLAKDELKFQLQSSGASYVVTHSEVMKPMIQACEELKIPMKNAFHIGESNTSDLTPFSVLEDTTEIHIPHCDIEPLRDTSLLPFSSGTTGLPKGVMLSFSNILSNTIQTSHVEKLSDNVLLLLPMFHIYAFLLMNMSLYQGTCGVILPKFVPETLLSTLETYCIPKAHVVPPLVVFLGKNPLVDQYDLSKTKYLISAAAPLGKDVEDIVRNRLSIQVKQCYGMTELSPISHYMDDNHIMRGSVGRLIPNTEQRVICLSTGNDVKTGEIGEISIRGPQVMLGYRDRPEATNEAFTEDGFLRTGDLGYVDKDGNTFIVDRVKELIKYKGHQIAPGELENILLAHPSIQDAACVRSFEDNGEEIPKAYIVLRKDAIITNPNDILQIVNSQVAPFKKIRAVEVTPNIPKTATGKILRRQLQVLELEKLNKKAKL